MCILTNISKRKPYPPPDPDPKDPTDPEPTPTPEPENPRSYSGTRSLPALGLSARLSGRRSEALDMAISELFSTMGKVESAFALYSSGKVEESEHIYQEAVDHALALEMWLGKLESSIYEHLSWHEKRGFDQEDERLSRQVSHEDVADRTLRWEESTESDPVWEAVSQSVRENGYIGLLKSGSDNVLTMRELARNVLASLEVAQPSIRSGKLFEVLAFRLETPHLEKVLMELASGLIRLLREANYASAIDVAVARKRKSQVPSQEKE